MNKETLENLNKFKIFAINNKNSESYPYKFEYEMGDIYIHHSHFDKLCLSFNRKGLVALHDNNYNEIWHLEKNGNFKDDEMHGEDILNSFLYAFVHK